MSAKTSMTVPELAKHFSRDERSIRRWVDRPGFPKADKSGRRKAEAVQKWFNANIVAAGGRSESGEELDRERTLMARLKREQLESTLVPATWHRALLGRWEAEVRAHMADMCDTIPAGWPYKTAVELRDACREIYTALCERINNASAEIKAELGVSSEKDPRAVKAASRRHRTWGVGRRRAT